MSFIEREKGGERAILVHVDFYHEQFEDALPEFKELARSAGVKILDVVTTKRDRPEAKYFVGSGKAEEIRDLAKAVEADIILFNHDLSPSQERNLEKLIECRVVDRTGLILDIFAQRARTHEGKLQVELAQLKHMATRLVRGWTHLERQKGGIGLRGPGETQLETDRRLIGGRIKFINKRLDKVLEQRHQSRRARQRAALPTISLVGYTNAGKSTLFNRLTDSNVYAAHQLFATLDPTLRTVQLPPIGKVILVDTVGFIRDLPHDLVAAFRATLEETRQADLLLHVVDSHHPEKDQLIEAVDIVLEEIGATDIPVLKVYNKIDLRPDTAPRIDRDEHHPWRVWCSALTGAGMSELITAMTELLAVVVVTCEILLEPELAGKIRAKLYQQQVVEAEEHLKNGQIKLKITLSRANLDLLLAESGVSLYT